MKKHALKVALKISALPLPQKLRKAITFVENITGHPQVFSNPVPSLASVNAAISSLQQAMVNAADGGKTKTAIMHEKESHLMKLLNTPGHYVEMVADGDPEIIIMAGMEVKRNGAKHIPVFEVKHGAKGTVKLRVKPQPKTIYRWEYSKDPDNGNTWVTGRQTDVCMTTISGLEEGVKYWFRVVFVMNDGNKIPYEPLYLIAL